MRYQFYSGEALWNRAVGASSAILKTFMKSGYSAYLTGKNILTDTKGAVEELVDEARAELHPKRSASAKTGDHGSKALKQVPSRPRRVARKKPSGIKPGAAAPAAGQYQEMGPRGGKGREIASEKGEPLPPTTKKGSTYTLVQADDEKSGSK